MKKICVISQPTFCPWLGWFDQVDQSSVMVVLDDVAFSKRSWQQRNRIRTNNGLEFITLSVISKGKYDQKILDCQLTDRRCINKIIKSLEINYARAPFFRDVIDEFANVIIEATTSNLLVELNCRIIDWMATKLEISTPILRASQLKAEGHRGEHLAEICHCLDFNHYLSAPGAEEYLIEDKNAFDERNITISIHMYEHPTYAQCFNPFIPYASALDVIFNEGPRAASVMRSGRRGSRILRV
jgi:hypothetical protein